ncbi:MAG: hypothetical protein MJE77_07955 [Proteobacteria bacterium]|nr:hypothetical protein [Pseudomonadota bacterium]
MGDAYTPGLTVTASAVVRKSRRLPLAGKVVAAVGQRVSAGTVVARTELPGKVHLVNLANRLGVLPDELAPTLRVDPGQDIEKGQLLAQHKSFFGLLQSSVESPIDGVFESVSTVTGQAVLRQPPDPVEVNAYIDGVVVEEIASEGVVVETRAAMVQGIFGLAGEVQAPLVAVAGRPDMPLTVDDLDKGHARKAVIGGGRITLQAMRRALELGVSAVITGGIAYHDVKELLGYDVGVAVTGTERLATTLVITEGFGDIAMARETFELLSGHAGKDASINGSTQIRAGVIRPEVVIPLEARAVGPDNGDRADKKGLEVGVEVRCIRAPYFGRIGQVIDLPVALHTMPSESQVRVLAVDLGDPEPAIVPRANVEVIEQ